MGKYKNSKTEFIESAAALRYEPEKDNAPVVVAAGKGDLARSIKELAEQNNIPIFKDPVLAKTLNDLGNNVEIPPPLYNTIAKILAYVYEIDQRKKGR